MNTNQPTSSDLDEIRIGLSSLIESLRGARVLIIGGTGFFGRWLLESIVWMNARDFLGIETTVISREPGRLAHLAPHLARDSRMQFVAADVRAPIPQKLGAFDYIVHAATSTTARGRDQDPLEMIDTIVTGTRNALEFAAAGSCRSLLLTSSGAVYGTQPPEVEHVSEDCLHAPDCTSPQSAYGESKRLTELLCAAYAAQGALACKIARCFAFVGPFLPLDAHFAIGNFIRDGLSGGPIHIQGDGAPYRSYMYATDLCIWLWTILLAGEPGRAYNVGSEDASTIAEIAAEVARAFSPPSSVVIAKQRDPSALPARYIPSTRRAQAELGLGLRVDRQEAVRRTIRYHQSSI